MDLSFLYEDNHQIPSPIKEVSPCQLFLLKDRSYGECVVYVLSHSESTIIKIHKISYIVILYYVQVIMVHST